MSMIQEKTTFNSDDLHWNVFSTFYDDCIYSTESIANGIISSRPTLPFPPPVPPSQTPKNKMSERTMIKIIEKCRFAWKTAHQLSVEVKLSKGRLLYRYLKPMVKEGILEVSKPTCSVTFSKRSFRYKQM